MRKLTIKEFISVISTEGKRWNVETVYPHFGLNVFYSNSTLKVEDDSIYIVPSVQGEDDLISIYKYEDAISDIEIDEYGNIELCMNNGDILTIVEHY